MLLEMQVERYAGDANPLEVRNCNLEPPIEQASTQLVDSNERGAAYFMHLSPVVVGLFRPARHCSLLSFALCACSLFKGSCPGAAELIDVQKPIGM